MKQPPATNPAQAGTMSTEIQETATGGSAVDAIALSSDDEDNIDLEDAPTQVYVDDVGEVHHAPLETATATVPPRLQRQHRPLLQFVGITMLPSTPTHLNFDAMLRNAEQLSAEMHAARERRRRYPSIPKNAPRAVKTERVLRVLDPATDVPADAACIVCQEKRGRKRSAAWQSPCCSVYFCDGCSRNFVRYPHRGVCEACTRCARSRGGAHCVPLGGPPGPVSCHCRYLCPQQCSPDGMRSFKVEMEAQAALEAAAKARAKAQAEKKHRRPRMKRSRGGDGDGGGGGGTSAGTRVKKRRRVVTV